jgi:hypothetical protein
VDLTVHERHLIDFESEPAAIFTNAKHQKQPQTLTTMLLTASEISSDQPIGSWFCLKAQPKREHIAAACPLLALLLPEIGSKSSSNAWDALFALKPASAISFRLRMRGRDKKAIME